MNWLAREPQRAHDAKPKALLAVVRGCSWSQSIVKEITRYARRSLSGSLSDASSILAASTKNRLRAVFFLEAAERAMPSRSLSVVVVSGLGIG